LYDYYQSYNTFKDVWEALTKKYDTEEAGVKKYDVSRYMKYHRADPSPVQTGLHNWASKLEGPQFFFMQQ
jgi:cytochrome oxidase Cu insertion factor (SCO1/SenC/PrrC family)